MGIELERKASNSPNWYLVYTKPKQEKLAVQNLERQGFECYLPMIRVRKRSKNGARMIIEPLFPRYVFLRQDAELKSWAPIRSTVGVNKLVIFGDKPAVIGADLVNLIRSEEEDGCIQSQDYQFTRGQRVRVIGGLMNDYEAIFVSQNSEERVIIMLDIVGRNTRLNISVDQLEPFSL